MFWHMNYKLWGCEKCFILAVMINWMTHTDIMRLFHSVYVGCNITHLFTACIRESEDY